MMEAAGRVSTGLVTFAARNSDFDGHKIKKGDIMAMENGKIVNQAVGARPKAQILSLL